MTTLYINKLKRHFDVFFALVFILCLSPVFLAIIAYIWSVDGRPIFFKGCRAGLYGKPFTILKFRTMMVGSELGASTTSKNDARITKSGAFLRQCKLDELPQLFNILVGHMSFVGPRPELFKYTNRYNSVERRILSVRPGLTDYSSIHFASLNELVCDNNPDDFFELNILKTKNRLRVKYVSEQSLLVDLVLILKTIRLVSKRLLGVR